MTVPPAWVFLLGALAAWRVYKLISVDTILDRPRDWITSRSEWANELISCPYCAGWWVSAIGAAAYLAVSDVPLSWGSVFGWAVTAFALSAVVVFLEIVLDLTVAKKDLTEAHAEELED